MRATGAATANSTPKLAAATLARCFVCQTSGPVERLTEHLREDHALRGDALRRMFQASVEQA